MSLSSLEEFLEPVNPYHISEDEGYETGQIGQLITDNNDLEAAKLVLIGCHEWRGSSIRQKSSPADAVRHQLYKLFHWHHDITIADAGTIKPGATLEDTYAAMRIVVKELVDAGKKVLVIGGSHDNTLGLYQSFAERGQIIEATVIDALIDLDRQSPHLNRRFLLDMLTTEPNFIRHFNLIGFQSYFTYPNMLETIDKLRFDCFRVGRAQEKLEEVEPAIRGSQLLSVDMSAMAHAYAPAGSISPNGFTGQDMCRLMQFAGMSATTTVAGIFNYFGRDPQNLTALQIAQMIWYFMDGMQKLQFEPPLEERQGFNEYHTLCAEVDTTFLQSKNTGRWWMQMPDSSFIPCTYLDYVQASNNDLPERWLRTQERAL